ncbi:hypothetical protein JCM10296v2_006391 [Rhodotorula toruloides]
MHPPLADHQQGSCTEVMQALKQCHDANPWMKFAGACNSQKHALNMCLREERLERTRKNQEAAKEKRKAVEQRWKELEDEA